VRFLSNRWSVPFKNSKIQKSDHFYFERLIRSIQSQRIAFRMFISVICCYVTRSGLVHPVLICHTIP
jgi:hypothetical protein